MAAAQGSDLDAIARWCDANPEKAVRRARRMRALRAVRARDDVNAFMEHVMMDERPGHAGEHVRQAPVHRALQHLADTHPYLLLWSHPDIGKTHNLAIGRTLWELGRNPNLRFLIVSSRDGQANKVATTIMQYIDTSAALKEVFPHLTRGDKWSVGAFTVKRDVVAKDFSILCSGLTAKPLGGRFDRIILDDIVTSENAFTTSGREGLRMWFDKYAMGRLTDNGRIIFMGNAFSPDDLMHTLERLPLWHAERFPLLDANGNSNWPGSWSVERINTIRSGLTPEEFTRQYQCVARDDSSARFKREWIDKAFARGEGLGLIAALKNIPNGCSTHTGVDLGARIHGKADRTVFFTFLLYPNGDMRVLEILAGRWSGPDIVERIVDVSNRFGSTVYVENVAAQQHTVDWVRKISRVRVVPFQTDRRKHDPQFGVEGIAVDLNNGKWIFPNPGTDDLGRRLPPHPELQTLRNEMLYYDPRPGVHTGDSLMSMWIAVEGSRRQNPPKVQFGRMNLNTKV